MEEEKSWYEINKERILAKAKERYASNKEELIEKSKEWKKANREKNLAHKKKYREKNVEKIKAYKEKNKEKIKNYSKEYRRNRKDTDLLYSLKFKVSKTILKSLKKENYTKKSRTHEILGCSWEEFKLHLESQFESWMTWDNRGLFNGEKNYGWDIDHIVPLASAATEEDVLKLNHYTNLQPLCGVVNRFEKKDN